MSVQYTTLFSAQIRRLLSLFIFFLMNVAAAVAGPGDTVSVSRAPSLLHKSLVQSMSREQLNNLVDFLMEMDTIPADLAKEIEIASERFRRMDENEKEPVQAQEPVFPGSGYYATWEINHLFPEEDMLKMKGDTSVCLTLRGNYVHPFNGPVTSDFGWRDSTKHNGIDIDLNKGDKVAAAFDGMVRVARLYGGFGNVVIIRHYSGLETVYAHLSKIKVKPGQVIKAGQIIGLGGSTGHSTGSHLHFEVRFKGVPINPRYLISFSDQKLLCTRLMIRQTKWGIAAYPKDAKFYTVEKGDTLFEIAKRFGITTASIRKMNGFNTGRVRLKAGQQISVMK